jgi:hypothetical protein
LEDHDFQEGCGGTCWRARSNLGGRLAQRMTDSTSHFFQSYAIYRRSEVHIVQPEHFDEAKKLQQAKFIFALNATSAWFGFYIEKNSGPMDKSWRWPTMIAALASDAHLREEVEGAMRQHDLHWHAYVWDQGRLSRELEASADGLLWEQAEQPPEVISWYDFVRRLDGVEEWVDLFLTARLSKEQAMGTGASLADPVIAVFRALLPLYQASTVQTAGLDDAGSA